MFSYIHEDQRYQDVLSIISRLRQEGYEALLAGGCVRDLLRQEMPKDFDVATNAKPEQVEAIFKRTIPVGKQFGVILVVVNNCSYEVATFRKDVGYSDGRHPDSVEFTNAEEDAKRRDFRMNGLFYDVEKDEILDYVEGQADIQNKKIQSIGNPEERFEEDYLRVLRAVRFAASLGYEIESHLWEAIRKYASCIVNVSEERIRDELVKMLASENPSRGLNLLQDSKLLTYLLPELTQKPNRVSIDQKIEIYKELEDHGIVAVFAVLFMDLGREHNSCDEQERKEVRKQVEAVMKRLRFSNNQTRSVARVIENQIQLDSIENLRDGELKRIMSDPWYSLSFEIYKIRCSVLKYGQKTLAMLQNKCSNWKGENLSPNPLISGNDLLAIGFKEGPELKYMLDAVYVEQLEGNVATTEDALAWIRREFPIHN